MVREERKQREKEREKRKKESNETEINAWCARSRESRESTAAPRGEKRTISSVVTEPDPGNRAAPRFQKFRALGQRAASGVSGSNDTWTTTLTEHVDPDLLDFRNRNDSALFERKGPTKGTSS